MKAIFVDAKKCLSCHSCELACSVAHSESKNLYAAISEAFPKRPRVHVEAVPGGAFPIQCRHCEDPVCVKTCVSNALFVDEDSGAVLHDEGRCIGCRMCILACPFGVIEEQEAGGNSCAVSKCDLCAAEPGGPACIAACPTGALSFESAEAYSKDKRRKYLIQFIEEEVQHV
ncbi:MAG: 4Fe-4S dicluster domain-containing protein [Clostridiales Family XIII bacterium]|nr:4Fe-4S dicluster domain-containing protein [Clostridiales Family XIII bacterium]